MEGNNENDSGPQNVQEMKKNSETLEEDVDDSTVQLSLPEFDDEHDDQFGRPFCDLYREITPDFDKTHEKGLKAFKRLEKYFL